MIRNVVADAIQVQPEAAKIDGNTLVSTGAPGFVMYGPYVAFAPGTYHVVVKGGIPNMRSGAEVHFDFVSSTAKTIDAEQVVSTTLPSGDILSSTSRFRPA